MECGNEMQSSLDSWTQLVRLLPAKEITWGGCALFGIVVCTPLPKTGVRGFNPRPKRPILEVPHERCMIPTRDFGLAMKFRVDAQVSQGEYREGVRWSVMRARASPSSQKLWKLTHTDRGCIWRKPDPALIQKRYIIKSRPLRTGVSMLKWNRSHFTLHGSFGCPGRVSDPKMLLTQWALNGMWK